MQAGNLMSQKSTIRHKMLFVTNLLFCYFSSIMQWVGVGIFEYKQQWEDGILSMHADESPFLCMHLNHMSDNNR